MKNYISIKVQHFLKKIWNFLKPFNIKTDALKFALGAFLLQMQNNENIYLVVFYLRNFLTAKINYKIYNT